jgi:hypothetical protein
MGVSFMRRVLLIALGAVAGCIALSTAVEAGGPDPADYPLRVLVFKNTTQSGHPREPKNLNNDGPDYVDGMGVADLFEGGTPSAFQYTYSCIEGMRASSGYETFPAKWKKRGKTVQILLPRPGKPWDSVSCDLKAEMRDGIAFYWKDDEVAAEGSAAFKEWMVKHQYDPENDKNDPVGLPQ